MSDEHEEINPENIITLSDGDVDRIKEFIPKRFGSIQEFVTRAINVNAAWEENPFTAMSTFSHKAPTMDQYYFLKQSMSPILLDEMFPNYPERFGEKWEEYSKEKGEIENQDELKNSSKNQREERRDKQNFKKVMLSLHTAQYYVKNKNFETIVNDKNEIKYDGWPLLFTHYSRVFPVQIGLHVLGNLMLKHESTMINLEQFTKEAYDVAEEIAEKYLKREKKDDTLKRVKKISIGLPKPYDDDEKITSEQAIKEQRYKDRNFGKIKKSKEGYKTFEGLMSALGLIRAVENKDEIQITFSDNGKKLYLMENPIFENTEDATFSSKEQEFLIKHVISKRELETKLIEKAKKIIRDSKDESNTVKEIDVAFQAEIKKFITLCSNSNITTRLEKMIAITHGILQDNLEKDEADRKQTPIEAIRIATLGRMAELEIIDWSTSGRESRYTLINKN